MDFIITLCGVSAQLVTVYTNTQTQHNAHVCALASIFINVKTIIKASRQAPRARAPRAHLYSNMNIIYRVRERGSR